MALNRTEILDALYAKLSALPGVITFGRRVRMPEEIPPSEQPALLMLPGIQTVDAEAGRPAVWTLNVDVVLYAYEDTPEGPSSTLNTLITTVEEALEADPTEPRAVNARFGASLYTTLGGRVAACRINGTIETDGGALGPQAVAVIPVQILTAT
jgi:hypothetical protein